MHHAKYFGIDLLFQATPPDHLHVAQRGDIAEWPALIALGFMNNTGIAGPVENCTSCRTGGLLL